MFFSQIWVSLFYNLRAQFQYSYSYSLFYFYLYSNSYSYSYSVFYFYLYSNSYFYFSTLNHTPTPTPTYIPIPLFLLHSYYYPYYFFCKQYKLYKNRSYTGPNPVLSRLHKFIYFLYILIFCILTYLPNLNLKGWFNVQAIE